MSIPEARDFVVGMKFKPPPSYEHGAFVRGPAHEQFVGSLVGGMLPQPPVQADTECRLDDTIGAGFGLIAQDREVAEWMVSQRQLLWPELHPMLILLSRLEQP